MKIQKRWLFIFLLPAVAIFSFVYAVPVSMLIGTSFTDWVIAYTPNFIGIANYIELLAGDEQFFSAVWNTVVWILLQSTVHILIGLLAGLFFTRKGKFFAFAKTVYMFPNIISSVAVGMLFVMILNPSFGIVNTGLEMLGFENLPNWFGSSSTAFWSVTITWLLYAATITILIMAEIAAIDYSVIEASIVEGASEFQRNIYIILPALKNIIGTSTILAATSMLQKLDIIMMTTRGGPGEETLNLPLYVYNTAFITNKFGLANAVGVLMIVLGLIVVGIINKIYSIGKQD